MFLNRYLRGKWLKFYTVITVFVLYVPYGLAEKYNFSSHTILPLFTVFFYS